MTVTDSVSIISSGQVDKTLKLTSSIPKRCGAGFLCVWNWISSIRIETKKEMRVIMVAVM